MRISDWSSDVCSSDLLGGIFAEPGEILAQLLLVRVLRDSGRGRERDRQRRDGKKRAAGELGHRRHPLYVGDAAAMRSSSGPILRPRVARSEEHTSELQSLMRISYAVFCLKKKKNKQHRNTTLTHI